jgi:hypothetical protein
MVYSRKPKKAGREKRTNAMKLKTILVLVLFGAVQALVAGAKPFVEAHAHNDYLHDRPLFDALQHGFCSVEVDIHLVNGQLLVGHDLKKTGPERTLETLYLKPLRNLVRKNGGHVFPDGPSFTLLIDLKTEWQYIYPVLRTTLTNYAEMLTSVQDFTIQTNAVQVIITGNRSPSMFAGERIRYAAVDGDFMDLDGNRPATLISWISIKWKDHFSWDGVGAMPGGELRKLESFVAKAHANHRRIRFWGTPDNPNFWRTMLSAKVDLINTDELADFETFMNTGTAE